MKNNNNNKFEYKNEKNRAYLINYSADPLQMTTIAAWASTELSETDLENLPVQARLKDLFESNSGPRLHTPEDLVEFLAENGHTSPFRHNLLTYLIVSDLSTHVQFLKHRIGVEINSESARYHRLDGKFHIPDDLFGDDCADILEDLINHQKNSYQRYQISFSKLRDRLGKTRAKEIARYFLPTCYQISYVVSLSLQALGHFYNLRAKPDAQKEIRDLAIQMIAEFEKHVPNSEMFAYLIKHGKLC